MRESYVETEYAYSSARIRFRENSLLTKENFQRMLDARTSDEVLGILFEKEPDLKDDKSEVSENISPSEKRERILQKYLKNIYSLIAKISPMPILTSFFQYQYDCNNIKMAIKCRMRGIEPDGMLFDIGTVSTDKIKSMAKNQIFTDLPQNMARAAEDAVVEYSKSKNPQKIDIILDKACFADMLDAAEETQVPYIEKLVRSKIDLTNFLITFRVLRMKGEESNELSLFHDSLIDGGEISINSWEKAYRGGKENVKDKLLNSEYRTLVEQISPLSDKTLSQIEKICDNYWFDIVKEAKYITYGAPVLVGYVLAAEYQIKNIRIILAGKAAELSSDVIRERMRHSYV